uniref:Uncharacterized protein n=1 Tax=uncultured prokaryote TaxID=198431 RepID=A0A0H5Q393_9ZZZZ|nr:hypothetical protein [uncultured prokaryote]
MPVTQVRISMSRTLGDIVQWSYGIDGPTPDNIALTGILSAMQVNATATSLNTSLSILRLELAEAFDADGGPAVAVASVATEPFCNGPVGVQEVAVVCSEHVDTPRGLSPRGRTYYGPISGTLLDDPRPSTGLQTIIRNFHEAMLDYLVGEGWTPVVISRSLDGSPRPTAIGMPITAISTDDAWDSQRRRGLEPENRIVQPFPAV